MLFRIYAADLIPMNVSAILVARGIQSFSITRQEGFWRGTPEASLIVEVFGDEPDLENRVWAAAEDIRAANNQEVVHVVALPCHSVRARVLSGIQ